MSAHAQSQSTSPPPVQAPRRHLLPPRPVLRIYGLAWLPVLLIYLVAAETDGDWTRHFDLVSAIHSTVRNLGPQFLLLLLLWPITGWMEDQRFGPARTVLNHLGLAFVFAFVWHAALWLVIWAEYNLAAAERARQNWFIWQIQWGMMMYAAAAGGFSAYRAVQRARADAAAAEQAHTLLARTELAALRNKLNPHFLFNTLHSILALVRRDGAQAEAALFKFSDMLRYLLDTERSGQDMVLLRDEMAFTEQYLALESLRLGQRLQIDWQVEDHALDVSVPALCVQPLVENSIKHAFNPRSQPGTLRIQVRREGPRLQIEIADDGPGLDLAPGALPSGTGLGLPTVARRLALQYGSAAQFKVDAAPRTGFKVCIQLPASPT